MTKSISETGITLCAKIRLLFLSDKYFSPKFAMGSIHLLQRKRVKDTFFPTFTHNLPKNDYLCKVNQQKKVRIA